MLNCLLIKKIESSSEMDLHYIMVIFMTMTSSYMFCFQFSSDAWIGFAILPIK